MGTPTENTWKEATTTQKFKKINSIHLGNFRNYYNNRSKL